MQGDGYAYYLASWAMVDGRWSWAESGGGPFKAMLVSGYTFNPDHATIVQVRPYEVSGPGYTAGGMAITARITSAGYTRLVQLVTNPSWAGLDVGTPSHMIIYFDGGTDGSRYLIFAWELGVASGGGSYTVQMDEGDPAHTVFDLAEAA